MESKEPKKCPFCGADQPEGQLHITKSGFFKMNPYREYVFREPLESWFAAVEAALGFKLFFWQKTYIENGFFRCYGRTTAEILRDLSQIDEPPLNLIRYRMRDRQARWYCEELLRVKEALTAAGVPTREVLLTEHDRQDYLRRQQEGKVSVKMEPRPIGKFWDI